MRQVFASILAAWRDYLAARRERRMIIARRRWATRVRTAAREHYPEHLRD